MNRFTGILYLALIDNPITNEVSMKYNTKERAIITCGVIFRGGNIVLHQQKRQL